MSESSEKFKMLKIAEAKRDQENSYAATNSENGNNSQYKIVLISKGSRSSSIWNYFGLAEKENATPEEKKNHQSDRLLCLLCYNNNTIHVYMKSTSSGNLWRHLNKKHGILTPKDKNVPPTDIKVELNSNHLRNTILSLPNNLKSYQQQQQHQIDDSTIFSAQIDVSENNEKTFELSTDNGFNTKNCCINSSSKDVGSLLISEVAKRPELYMPPGQCKKVTRELLWREIYEAMGKVIGIDHLQKIWKNIRDRYRKLKNLDKQGLSANITKYKYYDQLRFLDEGDFIEDTQNGTSDDPLETFCEDDGIEIIEENQDDQPPSIKKVKLNFKLENSQNSVSSLDHHQSDGIVLEAGSENLLQNINFDNDIDTDEMMTNFNNAQDQSTIMKYCNCNRFDEFDLFGKFIAEKLRKYPKSKSDEIEIKIMQILQNE